MKNSRLVVDPDVMVTPELALEWLTNNEHNRKISSKHVALLASQMARNEFHFVGDPIRFDVEGRLLDGQHRLSAIVESETSQRMVVVSGLPPESQIYMDAGRKRTPGDQLSVALGIRNGNYAAGIIRTYIRWRDSTLLSDTRKIGIPEIVAWAESHQDLILDAVTRARRVQLAKIPTSVACSGAVYLAAHRLEPEDAGTFWDRMADGVDLVEHSPILTLRNGIIQRAKRDRWTIVEEWAYYTRAWNTWRKNGLLQRLQGWRDGITLENLRLR